MSLEPPFLDPEYAERQFWGVISDSGEGETSFGPYKYLVTKALVKHATMGDAERTVKVKVGKESEGNLYRLGFRHLTECVGRTIQFTQMTGVIEGKERMWYVATSAREVTRPVPQPEAKKEKAKK